MISEFRELAVEVPHRGFLLLEEIGDQRLFFILKRLLLDKELLDLVHLLFVRHSSSF